jgi:tetratricopeptide (TPR) repeat protein
VKAVALNDSVEALQETRSDLNPSSIVEEKQHLSLNNLIEPEEIEAQAPDNLQVISNVETVLQVEPLNKQARESASPIRALVSADTKAKEKSEKRVDSGTDQSVGDTILQEEAEDSIVLAQKESAVEETPNADAYISRGASKLKKGQIEGATSDFNKAIDLDPQKAEAYVARGGVSFMLDQFDNAISDYNKAIERNPDLAVAYQNRGSVYYSQGQFDNAISDYSKAIEIDNEFTAAYQNRGYAYFSAGNYEKAISDYDKAIALNPENAEAYICRGHSYYARRSFNKAISNYNKSISLNPENANAYTYRGHVYFSNRIFDKAISDYDKAIALNPEAAVAKKFLALAKKNRTRAKWQEAEFNHEYWRMMSKR